MHDPIYISNWQLDTIGTNEYEWTWFDHIFSDGELENIIALGESLPVHDATTARLNKPGTDAVRRGQVSWISPITHQTNWLFQRLTESVMAANEKYFGFDIREIEPLQYTRYDNIDDHYTWHKDTLPHITGHLMRKLSFILVLTDPQEHDGGDIELWFDNQPTHVPVHKGKIILFPSYALHRITPITRGRRRSLVGWVKGPRWR